MKKLTIWMIAVTAFALLLTGCDNGNVSDRTDGVVDGTNSTTTATFPSPSESSNNHETNTTLGAATDGMNTTESTAEETNEQSTTGATSAVG